MPLSPANAELRERSGAVNSSDPLVSFLYHLIRDYLTPGEVEGVLQDHVFCGDATDSEFCNGYLASYAKDVAARLRGIDRPQQEVIASSPARVTSGPCTWV